MSKKFRKEGVINFSFKVSPSIMLLAVVGAIVFLLSSVSIQGPWSFHISLVDFMLAIYFAGFAMKAHKELKIDNDTNVNEESSK